MSAKHSLCASPHAYAPDWTNLRSRAGSRETKLATD